jgi:toxin ParE1/3/4
MIVVWLPRALRRVEQAVRYIEHDKPVAAEEIARRIFECAQRLARFPEMGRAGRLPDTRELVVPNTPFILVYRVREDRVEILTLLHGSRRWPTA